MRPTGLIDISIAVVVNRGAGICGEQRMDCAKLTSAPFPVSEIKIEISAKFWMHMRMSTNF